MKKTLKILIPAILLLFIGFMIYTINNKINFKKEAKERREVLPEFSFVDIKNKAFTNKHLQKETILIIYFSTDCGHCKYEAEEISKNKEKFANAEVLFISEESAELIKEFSLKYKLDKEENILFLHDKDLKFDEYFGISGVPSLFIYSNTGKLKKHFKGEVKIETVLEYL